MGLFDLFKKKRKVPAPKEYVENLKKYAFNCLPRDINSISSQREMLRTISLIIPVNEFLMGIDVQKVFETNSLGELSAIQFSATIAFKTDRWAGGFNEKKLLENIYKADIEILIRCWAVLDFYCEILKTEYKVNLTKYYDYISTEIFSRGFQIPVIKEIIPVTFIDNSVHIDSKKFMEWKEKNPNLPQYELCGVIPLTDKNPIVSVYEDGEKTVEYCLQTEGEEDFTGKYFMHSVRVGFTGNPPVPTMQMDGFISDTPEDRKMELSDIGYRMEGHYLAFGGDVTQQRNEALRGQDLVMKGLKYQGYTTPRNIRLIGICPDCGKSFAFHGYAFYMAQSDVAYSDNGLDVCEIVAYDIDKETWKYETEGKTFRYYNSFSCPHCGTPYIDYKKYPENKVFGVSGCVHLGRKYYRAE